ncbi:MAG: tripartite tricarboxylate transporter substrate binding protein [Betaproteobacteria bacterium]|nr:tripartite tricarboxylate transporter substrate binding protein [Betaproteobacteria bacterium]
MRQNVRRVCPLILLGAAVCCTGPAQAQQNYPVRPIRLVVPSSPGGGTDITARIIAPKLGEYLGQQVVVENRPGAGTMIGGEVVARAAPDGYTLLMGISTLAINPAMYKKVPYDALKDFAPISQVVALPNILVTHPSLPVKSVKDLIAFAKARPGQINFASAGVGTNPHLSMELFLSMAGLKMIHVPYKGSGQGVIDLLAGHVPVMTPSILTALPYVKNKRLRALGVTSAKRAGGTPDIPTIAEAGVPGYEAVQWFGVLAPAGTPRPIITRLHGEVVRTLQAADVRQRLVNDGADPVGSSPEEFAAFLRAETTKWAKVVKDIGIQPE